MRRSIPILFLLLAVFSCSKPESPDPSVGGPGTGNETPPPSPPPTPPSVPQNEYKPGKWEAVADSCTFVLVENFLVKEKGVFMSRPGDGKASNGIYWQQAHAIDVLNYAFRRLHGRDDTRAEAYKRYIGLWFENNANNYDTSHRQEGKYGCFFNPYTDDMAWICLTLLNFAETFSDAGYADVAKGVYDHYIITRLMTNEQGRTGLPWTNNPDKGMGLNACTNAPACAVACRLYNRYKTKKYLDDALLLYRHLYDDIYNPATGRLEDPPLTYTQGTFAEACRLLFHITGEAHYLDTAYDLLAFAYTKDRCTGKVSVGDEEWRILRSEGVSMDQALFKSVLIPYTVNFIQDTSVPAARRDEVKACLLRNGEMLERTLDRRTWPQMYACYFWGKTWTEWAASNQAELDRFGGSLATYKVAMSAQASGASLMEGLARLEREP